MITIDSREKKISHITAALNKLQVPYEIKKLDYGDYADSDNTKVIVDRKQNLSEIAQNLCSKDNRRFWNEIRGAHKAGIKIIVVCEHGPEIRSIRDVAKWKNPYSQVVTGNWLVSEMFKLQMAYGVEWRFCTKAETTAEILKALRGKHG